MYILRKKTLAGVSVSAALAVLLASSALAQTLVAPKTETTTGSESIAKLPDLNTTTAGEPLHYLSTPDAVVSSDVLTVPPGGVTRWVVHPVPAYSYRTIATPDGRRMRCLRSFGKFNARSVGSRA